MTLCYPTTHKKLFIPKSSPIPKSKPIISSLHQDVKVAMQYSELINSKLDPNNIPSDLDILCDQITSSIQESVEAACPKSVYVKSVPPWECPELQTMISNLRKDPSNSTLRKNIRDKRKELKD